MKASPPPPKSTAKVTARRPRGTGTLFVKRDSSGRETWYGKWRVGTIQVKRRIGPKRIPSTREGLTRTQAEAELRRLIGAVKPSTLASDRLTVEEGGNLLLANVSARGRKRATIEAYSSAIRIHLVPFFAGRTLDRIGRREIEGFITYMARTGRSTKTTRNSLGILHSIFELARREGIVAANPCSLVEKPRAMEGDPDIRFLEPEEIEALLRGIPEDDLGRVERRMYLAAAMTGMRQGELLALRWRDIDWPARRVRIRRNYVRGEFGTPKSKRSSRSVPLADAWRASSTACTRRPSIRPMMTSSSPTRTPASRSTARAYSSASRRRSGAARCARSASTTCATRSVRGWPPRACRCAPCRR